MDTAARSGCPINAAVEVLGDPWAMLVLRDIVFGNRRRFRELIAGSEEGIATNVLASRLKQLVAAGLLTATTPAVSSGRRTRSARRASKCSSSWSRSATRASPTARASAPRVRAELLRDGAPSSSGERRHVVADRVDGVADDRQRLQEHLQRLVVDPHDDPRDLLDPPGASGRAGLGRRGDVDQDPAAVVGIGKAADVAVALEGVEHRRHRARGDVRAGAHDPCRDGPAGPLDDGQGAEGGVRQPWRCTIPATRAWALLPTTSSWRKAGLASQDAPGYSCSKAPASSPRAEVASALRTPPLPSRAGALSSGLDCDLDARRSATPAPRMTSRNSSLAANAWACSTLGKRCRTYTSSVSPGSTMTSSSVQPCSWRRSPTVSYTDRHAPWSSTRWRTINVAVPIVKTTCSGRSTVTGSPQPGRERGAPVAQPR